MNPPERSSKSRSSCIALALLFFQTIDTVNGRVHGEDTFLEINVDDFLRDEAQIDDSAKYDRIDRKQLYDLNRYKFRHPMRKPREDFIVVEKNPVNMKLSDESFDLDYKHDGESYYDGFKSKSSQKIDRSRIERDVNSTKVDEEELEYPYDYENFHREYFDYIWEKKNESVMEPSRFYNKLAHISPIDDFKVCFPDDWQTGIGVIALYCTLQRGSTRGFTKAEFTRLGQILKFWAVVYLVAGGAMWMICGWCCCCLRCYACNPDRIRDEARSYVVYNPPGVMRNSLTGETIEYTPTPEEKLAHKELQIKAFAFV